MVEFLFLSQTADMVGRSKFRVHMPLCRNRIEDNPEEAWREFGELIGLR